MRALVSLAPHPCIFVLLFRVPPVRVLALRVAIIMRRSLCSARFPPVDTAVPRSHLYMRFNANGFLPIYSSRSYQVISELRQRFPMFYFLLYLFDFSFERLHKLSVRNCNSSSHGTLMHERFRIRLTARFTSFYNYTIWFLAARKQTFDIRWKSIHGETSAKMSLSRNRRVYHECSDTLQPIRAE